MYVLDMLLIAFNCVFMPTKNIASGSRHGKFSDGPPEHLTLRCYAFTNVTGEIRWAVGKTAFADDKLKLIYGANKFRIY